MLKPPTCRNSLETNMKKNPIDDRRCRNSPPIPNPVLLHFVVTSSTTTLKNHPYPTPLHIVMPPPTLPPQLPTHPSTDILLHQV
ncbi:hypothetical protein M758_8G117500 [Ceratodon purpureus]|nr:hypothetical protein M758_8G117500 [Ceratodon purpureus]